MVNPTKVWHLLPTFDIPPPPITASTTDSTPALQLGDLLVSKQPYDLRNPLNRASRPYIPTTQIARYGPRSTTHTLNTSSSGHVGFFAKLAGLIVPVGAEVDTSWSTSRGQVYNFQSEHDWTLSPDLSVQATNDLVLASDEVQTFLNDTSYRKPLYLVTGIKWVEGISISASNGREHGIEASLEGDLTAVGAPVTVGIQGGGSRAREEIHTAEGGPPFIFCVRLKKLEWRRTGELKEQKELLKGTFLGIEDLEGKKENERALLVKDAEGKDFRNAKIAGLKATERGEGENEQFEICF